ncbi:MAG TPA: site-specific integrase [Polyangia bacterium]
MASVINRGTKGAPLLYGLYKDGAGKWRQIAIPDAHRIDKRTAQKWIDKFQADVDAGKPDPRHMPMAGELMNTWIKSLTTRDFKNDRSRYHHHLEPKFKAMRIREITLPIVMGWIDELRAVPERERLSEGTMRQLFNLLSRFFSWAIERGHTDVNPCRMVPNGKRPQGASKSAERPWISDDNTVRALLSALASPYREMFYLGNRSGMRPGEVRGLRMSDVGHTDEEGSPVIRVRYSDAGPLKEDKRTKAGPSKPKWAPQPDDFDTMLGAILERRRAEGAGPDDFIFAPQWTRSTLKQYAEDEWRVAAETLRIKHTQYEATRHSMVTRNLSRTPGAMPEVSKAIGHHSVTTTEEHYDHVVIPKFSAGLRAPLAPAKLKAV